MGDTLPRVSALAYFFWAMLEARVWSLKVRHRSSEAVHHLQVQGLEEMLP